MKITEQEFIECKDIIEDLMPTIGADKWQTVFWKDDGPYCRDGSKFAVWCALLTSEAAEKSLNNDNLTFDLEFCSSGPDIGTRTSSKNNSETFYEPSHNKAIKPLVLYEYDEGLCEEFRLFHKCKLNRSRDRLVIEDNSGDLINIAKLESNRIQVHLKYLREFLAISQLHLVINIDVVRFSIDDLPYKDDVIQADEGEIEGFRWERRIAHAVLCINGEKWCGILRGKKIIAPSSRDEAINRKYESDSRRDEVEFIIGTDENGEDLLSGCNVGIVGEHLYLKAVQFKKQVLDKYYDEPKRFSVEEGCVRCNPHWVLRIDNDHSDKVIVFLGDLYHLPYKEMHYWKSFNVSLDGHMSRSNFRNSFECIPTDVEVADHKFKRNYVALNNHWKEVQGFHLFREPSEHDSTLFDTLQIPSVNEQGIFDDQVLILAKLLVDLINVKKLKELYGPFEEDAKSIQKLKASFPNSPEVDSFVTFLRNLQNLRSKGSAHTKGSDYKSSLQSLGISGDDKPNDFCKLLKTANDHMEALLSKGP